MRLRKPCEHGRYEEHNDWTYRPGEICPGGEFLADDALEQLSLTLGQIIYHARGQEKVTFGEVREWARRLLDALTVRQREGAG